MPAFNEQLSNEDQRAGGVCSTAPLVAPTYRPQWRSPYDYMTLAYNGEDDFDFEEEDEEDDVQ